METDDIVEELLGCIACGAAVSAEADRVFAITDEIVLCESCARARGGAYDEIRDVWAVAPRLEDLEARARPSQTT